MILRYVLRNFTRRKTRIAMGVLGVFCTLALLTAVHVGLESVAVSYVDLVSLQAGKADLLVRRAGADWFLPESFDAAEVAARLDGHPLLRGLSPRLAGVAAVSAGGDMRFAFAVGIDPARERELGIDGFTPWPALGPDACALSESLAAKLPGESVTVGGAVLKKAGTIARQLVFPQPVREYVVMDLATARKALGVAGGAHLLAGALRDAAAGYDARDLAGSVRALKDAGESVAAALGPDYAVSLPKAQAIVVFQAVSGPLLAVFGIFALVALAITAILVYSLVSVSAEERTREHAILRTLGARRRQVFGMVLAESAVLCLLGVVPGALCGALLARGVLAMVGLAIGGGAGAIPLAFTGATLRLCLGAGAAVAVASALLPAIRSTRRGIADALDPLRRGQIAERPAGERGVSRPLLLVGLSLAAIAGVVFFLLPGAVVSGDPALIGSVALGLLALLLVGLSLIAAAAAPLVERLVLAAGGRLFGPAAELAARNLARHRRRNATTSLLFALSVSFVLFLASLAALASRTALSTIDQHVGSDLRISLDAPRDPGFAEALRAVEGVGPSARVVSLRGRSRRGVAYDVTAADLVGMKTLWVAPFGVEDALAETILRSGVAFEEGDAGAFRALAADAGAKGGPPPPAIVSLSLARHLDVRKGSLLELTFQVGADRKRERVRIEAVCSAMPGFHRAFRAREGNAQGSGLLLSMRTFDRLAAAAPPEAFRGFCLVRAEGEAREVASRVRERLGLKYRLGVECAAEEKREAEALYWATQVLFAMLLGVAVAIALFGLVASMATAAIERRWEVGVLKAVGLRQGHLYRMFAAEAVALTVSGGLLGGGMGYLLAYLFVVQAAILMEIPIVFTVPWLTFAAMFAICALAGLVASWLPTRRLLGRPVAEILRGA